MHKSLAVKYAPAALLLIGAGLVFSTRSQRTMPLVQPISSVLPAYNNYRVTNQTVPEDERKIAGMTDYVARVFWKGDSTVAFTTYVGYYDRQTQGKSMHSPKNCLPGAGWEILKSDMGTVAAGGKQYTVNKYLLKNSGSQAVVYYWYQGRGRIVASEYAVTLNLLRDAAFEGHTEEALVRVVVPVPGAGRLAQDSLVKAYAAAERLGAEVGSLLLADVARILPAAPASATSKARRPARDARPVTVAVR